MTEAYCAFLVSGRVVSITPASDKEKRDADAPLPMKNPGFAIAGTRFKQSHQLSRAAFPLCHSPATASILALMRPAAMKRDSSLSRKEGVTPKDDAMPGRVTDL